MVLASGWVYDRGGMRPSLVQTGNKMYQLTLPAKSGSPKTTFRDSYLLVTRPLSELKKAFGLSDEDVEWVSLSNY